MHKYLVFFLGTRERAKISSIAFGFLLIMGLFWPQVITKVIAGLLGAILAGVVMAVGPFMGIMLLFGILFYGFKTMLKKPSGK